MLRREFLKLLGGLIAVGKIDGFAICPKSDVVTFWAPVARADVPNSNGRIYSKHVLEQAVSEFKSELMGQIGYPESPPTYRWSHKVVKLKMDQNYLSAKIEILDNPEGDLLKLSMPQIEFRTHGIGTFDDGVIRDDYKLIGIHALSIDKAAKL